MKNWLFSLQNFLKQSAIPKFSLQIKTDLSFKSFHSVSNVALTIYPQTEFMLLEGYHTYTKLYDTYIVDKTI